MKILVYMDDKMVDNGKRNIHDSNRMLNKGDMFDMFHILCLNLMHKIVSKRPTKALGFVDATLLHNDHRTVSATRGHLQDGEKKNADIIMMC